MDALTRLQGRVRESAGSENNAKNEIFSEKSSLSVTFGTFGDLPLLTLYTPVSVCNVGVKNMGEKTLEDIPGVGPAIAEKLREAGYTDIMAIAVAAPSDLAETC